MKKRKGKTCLKAFLLSGAVFLLFSTVLPATVLAGSLTDFTQDADHLYSRFPLENYDLDFYVDNSWSWLPWNWTDAVGRSVLYAVYLLTNFIWYLSRLISSATGMLVSEAYRLDLVNEAAEKIGENIQRLAGVSRSGISADGFYPGFLPLIVLLLGVYVAYLGLFKRETSRALGAVVKTVSLFFITTAVIVYAPEEIRDINALSCDISGAALRLGTGVVLPGTETGGENDSVELIRDNLFLVQVYEPWLLLQWGTTDTDAIGQDRVESLLAISPDEEYGDTRETAVKNEIETYGNVRMSVTKAGMRLAEAVFLFLINLIISIFIILLCAMMIFTQVLFIVYALFLVVGFVLSMFPECGGLFRKSVLNLINIVLLRAGYTLLITAAFSVSTMLYSLSHGHSFLLTGFLQIVTFAGIFLSKNELFQMMLLQENSAAKRMGAAGALLAGSQARRGRQTVRNVRRKAVEKVSGAGIAGMKYAAGKVKGTVSSAMQRNRDGKGRREQAGQEAASWKEQMNRETGRKETLRKAYPVAQKTPAVREAQFYARKKKRKQKTDWLEPDTGLIKYDTPVGDRDSTEPVRRKLQRTGRYNAIKLQRKERGSYGVRENDSRKSAGKETGQPRHLAVQKPPKVKQAGFYRAGKSREPETAVQRTGQPKREPSVSLENVKQRVQKKGIYNRLIKVQKNRAETLEQQAVSSRKEIPMQQNGMESKKRSYPAVRKSPKVKRAGFYGAGKNGEPETAAQATGQPKREPSVPLKNVKERIQRKETDNRVEKTQENRTEMPVQHIVSGQKKISGEYNPARLKRQQYPAAEKTGGNSAESGQRDFKMPEKKENPKPQPGQEKRDWESGRASYLTRFKEKQKTGQHGAVEEKKGGSDRTEEKGNRETERKAVRPEAAGYFSAQTDIYRKESEVHSLKNETGKDRLDWKSSGKGSRRSDIDEKRQRKPGAVRKKQTAGDKKQEKDRQD